MVGLILEEINLLSPLLVFSYLLVLDLLLKGFFLLLQLLHLFLIVYFFFFKINDGCVQLRGSLFGLELFAHGEGK